MGANYRPLGRYFNPQKQKQMKPKKVKKLIAGIEELYFTMEGALAQNRQLQKEVEKLNVQLSGKEREVSALKSYWEGLTTSSLCEIVEVNTKNQSAVLELLKALIGDSLNYDSRVELELWMLSEIQDGSLENGNPAIEAAAKNISELIRATEGVEYNLNKTSS